MYQNNSKKTLKWNENISKRLKEVGPHLDCHLFPIGDVDAQVDVSETSGSDFSDQTIFAAHDELGSRSRSNAGHFVDCFVRV